KKMFWGQSLLLGCILSCSFLQAQSGSDAGKSATDSQAAPASAPATSTSGVATDDATYVIGVDDVLSINVWKEPDISRVVPVRSDGKISLALVGEVTAGGKTPKDLKAEIADKLKSYISEPEVTVIVQEMRSKKFNIIGMVVRPGSFPLNGSITVLDSIAVSGGFRDFAKKKAIYVLRKKADGTQERLPFNYNDVIKGKNSEQNVKLMPGDTVVVP
ncbi:MAG TPA: polysaccharide biosynthesis/export family protein, partial [Terriglobales bacterium]|nr:polysaccharide biosynthesis/export family protein [Terriglobales bacterium]